MQGSLDKSVCSDAATCTRCGDEFALTPQQMVHPNCVPSRCEKCRSASTLQKTCRHCGEGFVRKGVGHPTAFCSTVCRDAFQSGYTERLAKTLQKPTFQHKCECGKDFESHRANAQWCPECVLDRRSSGKSKRKCERCGDDFRASKTKLCKACRTTDDRRRASQSSRERYKSMERTLTTNHSMSVGTIAERMFDMAGVRNGWIVMRPETECNPGFDRVVYRNNQFVRVQVKGLSGSRFGDGTRWELGGGWDRLMVNAIDEIAIVDVETGFMWLVPIGEARQTFHPSDYARYEMHCWLRDEAKD
jgi:hypothetical protein